WNGKPFIARVADAMRPHVDRLVVASRHDIDPSAYAAVVPDASILRDPTPFPGPVDGLRRALADDASERVVVAGCDSPALSPGVVGRLLDAAATGAGLSVLDHEGSTIYSVFAGITRLVKARCQQDRLRHVTSGAARVTVTGGGFNVNAQREALGVCPPESS
ncbi:MAG: NTP transferase domain-containing protein, partial [Candidatus Thermoplasmatota archaeon]